MKKNIARPPTTSSVFVTGLENAPGLNRALRFLDHIELREAAAGVSQWANAMQHLIYYKATLATEKRKGGLPLSVELAYQRALHRFAADVPKGIDAARRVLPSVGFR